MAKAKKKAGHPGPRKTRAPELAAPLDNTSTPRTIDLIPPESLERILSFVVPLYTAPCLTENSPPKNNSSKWSNFLPCISVCKAWRDTVLSCPRLWTFVDAKCMPLDVLKTFLERSGTMALDVCVDLDTTPLPTLCLIVDRIERIKNLSICLGIGRPPFQRSSESLSELFKSLCAPAPSLETFHVYPESARAGDYGYVPLPWLWYQFPAKFVDQFPRLRVLHLNRVLCWPRGAFKNLTSLHVSNCTTPRSGSHPFHRVIELLRESPCLRSARFSEDAICAPPDAFDGEVPTSDTVTLRHLETLRFFAMPYNCRRFLAYLDLSVHTHITIETKFDEEDQSHLDDLLPADLSRLGPLNSPIQELRVVRASRTCDVWVHLFSAGGGMVEIRSLLWSSRLSSHRDFPYDTVVKRVLLGFLERISLGNVKRLTVTPLSNDPPDWPGVFSDLPSLQSLTIEDTPSADIFETLMPKDGVDAINIYCPDLSHILMYCSEIPCNTLLALSDLMEARLNINHAIGNVEIRDCRANATDRNSKSSLKVLGLLRVLL